MATAEISCIYKSKLEKLEDELSKKIIERDEQVKEGTQAIEYLLSFQSEGRVTSAKNSNDLQFIQKQYNSEINDLENQIKMLRTAQCSKRKKNYVSERKVSQKKKKSQVTNQRDDEKEREGGDNEDFIALVEKEDLNVADQALWKDRVRESKLHIKLQGLLVRMMAKPSIDSERHNVGKITNKSLHYKGKIFHVGKCYHYCKRKTSRNIEIIVGIIGFQIQDKAICVLIVPVEETFLGEDDQCGDFLQAIHPVKYVKICAELDPLRLTYFKNECQKIRSIPTMMYEPQTIGNWQTFGYMQDKGRPRRVGRRKEMKCIDLFAGAGGMHQGFLHEGFETAIAVEKDSTAVESLSINSKNRMRIHQGDVVNFLQKCRIESYRKQIGKIHHLHASSPCQGFSAANRNGGKNDDKNNKLSLTFLEAVDIFKPVTATFENVEGMWRRANIKYIKQITVGLLRLGYQTRCTVLCACDYGDPQKRSRLFIFAARDYALLPSYPTKTHGIDPSQLPFVLVKNALDIFKAQQNIEVRTTSLKPGQHGVVRLNPDGLACTITASSVPPFHYELNRCISVNEAKVLQSFPLDFALIGSIAEKYKQIGNSVPVEMAIAVARSVRAALLYVFKEEGEDDG